MSRQLRRQSCQNSARLRTLLPVKLRSLIDFFLDADRSADAGQGMVPLCGNDAFVHQLVVCQLVGMMPECFRDLVDPSIIVWTVQPKKRH